MNTRECGIGDVNVFWGLFSNVETTFKLNFVNDDNLFQLVSFWYCITRYLKTHAFYFIHEFHHKESLSTKILEVFLHASFESKFINFTSALYL